MRMNANTILVTGGGTGIGRALAEALYAAGNTVVVAGRRAEPLDALVAANPGMQSLLLDVADPAAIVSLSRRIMTEYPTLNVLINNAGIMATEKLLAEPVDLAVAEATVATNLLGPIRLTAALLPLLRRQAAAQQRRRCTPTRSRFATCCAPPQSK